MTLAEMLRWLRTKCSRLFRRGKAEAALDAEIQFHLDQLIAQFRAEGMTEREARLAAQREFGNAGFTAKKFVTPGGHRNFLISGARFALRCVRFGAAPVSPCLPSSHLPLGLAGTR